MEDLLRARFPAHSGEEETDKTMETQLSLTDLQRDKDRIMV